jgi:hypothetical protein
MSMKNVKQMYKRGDQLSFDFNRQQSDFNITDRGFSSLNQEAKILSFNSRKEIYKRILNRIAK